MLIGSSLYVPKAAGRLRAQDESILEYHDVYRIKMCLHMYACLFWNHPNLYIDWWTACGADFILARNGYVHCQYGPWNNLQFGKSLGFYLSFHKKSLKWMSSLILQWLSTKHLTCVTAVFSNHLFRRHGEPAASTAAMPVWFLLGTFSTCHPPFLSPRVPCHSLSRKKESEII